MKTPRAPKPKAPSMEAGKPHFPRQVSSKTVHAAPPMKAPPSAGFDTQVQGLPSMGIKQPKMPKAGL